MLAHANLKTHKRMHTYIHTYIYTFTFTYTVDKGGLWGILNSNEVRSRFNILCPSAQLLISDRPANSHHNELANRLGRKERAPSLVNGTSTESNGEETAQGSGSFTIKEGGLSMVLPKSVMQTHALSKSTDVFPDGLLRVVGSV